MTNMKNYKYVHTYLPVIENHAYQNRNNNTDFESLKLELIWRVEV